MNRLDRSGGVGQKREWLVTYLSHNPNPTEDEPVFEEYRIEAAEMSIDSGVLVFRNENGQLVKAFGIGGWQDVERA